MLCSIIKETQVEGICLLASE